MKTLTELEHHGIKGMHWGVRKDTSSGGGGGRPAGRSNISIDAAKAATTKARISTGGTHAVSNQDLQHLVNRMNLEQQYSRLTTSSSTTGKSYVQNFLKKNGDQLLNKAAKVGIGILVAKAFKRS